MKTFPLGLTAALLLAAVAASARAQTVAPVPAPTMITTAPYTITKAGYYQLGADLDVTASSGNIITVAATNVILDFGGHHISGPTAVAGSTLYGVYANEYGSITVLNGKIAYCEVGVYFTGNGSATSHNTNHRVQNMLITHCSFIGIDLFYTTGCDVLDCRISFIGGSSLQSASYGVYTNGSGTKIANNEFSNVTAGAYQPNPETPGFGYGVFAEAATTFSIGNTFASCGFSIDGGKYQNNLTLPTNPPVGGTDAGGNN